VREGQLSRASRTVTPETCRKPQQALAALKARWLGTDPAAGFPLSAG